MDVRDYVVASFVESSHIAIQADYVFDLLGSTTWTMFGSSIAQGNGAALRVLSYVAIQLLFKDYIEYGLVNLGFNQI